MTDYVTKEELAEILVSIASDIEIGAYLPDSLRDIAAELRITRCTKCGSDMEFLEDDYCSVPECPHQDD